MEENKVPRQNGADSPLEFLSDIDERELAMVGKKSVLKSDHRRKNWRAFIFVFEKTPIQEKSRNFAFLSILGFSCSLMITWEGLFSVFVFGLLDGGPAGLVYGFLLVWIIYAAVVAQMAELVSMWPTAGGQYHWTHKLAPEKYKNVMSYITGWQSVIAWQAGSASCGYLTATAIQGLIINSQPEYAPQRWQGTLLVFAVTLITLIFNLLLSSWLPFIENAILFFHITLFFVLLVVLTVMAPTKSSSHDVWALFLHEGGYESKGLSFFVGLITPLFAFAGADGAVHMCEETKNASTVLPWAMMGSIAINGTTGFAMLIAILYCIGDIDTALGTPTGYPFIEILTQGVSSIAGGTALSALLVTMFICATVTIMASTSRQLWAFARDNAVPNAQFIAYVHPTMKIPVVSIAITGTIVALLSLINIGSATVFNAFVSLSIAGFFGSYLLPFSLLLYTRIYAPETLPWGPWRLGKAGIAVNVAALLGSVLSVFFSFWPTTVPVTDVNMNWSCVLWVAVVVFAGVFWIAHGKRVFTGPVVETDVGDLVA